MTVKGTQKGGWENGEAACQPATCCHMTDAWGRRGRRAKEWRPQDVRQRQGWMSFSLLPVLPVLPKSLCPCLLPMEAHTLANNNGI